MNVSFFIYTDGNKNLNPEIVALLPLERWLLEDELDELDEFEITVKVSFPSGHEDTLTVHKVVVWDEVEIPKNLWSKILPKNWTDLVDFNDYPDDEPHWL